MIIFLKKFLCWENGVLHEAQSLLTKALNFQEQLWKEKARDQNFVSGDRNTAYFYRVSKIRATTKSISFLQDGDNIIIFDFNMCFVHAIRRRLKISPCNR